MRLKKIYTNCPKIITDNWHIISILLVCILSILPFIVVKDIPKSDDLAFHLSRIVGLKDMMQVGNFRALIYTTFFNGYGYANGLFYPNFFIYISSFLCLLGVNAFTSYKVLIIICTFLTAGSMYFCVKKISYSKLVATIATFLYVVSPYRIVDIYERGALGEILAFIFIPFVILGIYELLYRDYKKWWYLAIGFCGLLMSHLLSFIMMLIVFVIILIINIKKLLVKKKRILYVIIPGLVSILLTAFFLFPMFEQLIVSDFVIDKVTVNWNASSRSLTLLRAFFDQGVLSFPCGIGIIFVLISGCFFKIDKGKDNIYRFLKLLLITGLILVIATTNVFPWNTAVGHKLAFIQFPWRFLLLATAFLSISSGIIVERFIPKIRANDRSLLILTILLGSIIFPTILVKIVYYDYKKVDVINSSVGYGEYLPYQTKKKRLIERGSIITTKHKMNYDFIKTGSTMFINYNNYEENNYMDLPLLYYYGYKAIDVETNKALKIKAGRNNVIRINIENIGSGHIKVYYAGTTTQQVSYIISVITLGGVALYFLYYRKEKDNESNK